MFVISHQIAGITFRTESDVIVPHVLTHPFKKFQVEFKQYDVHFRIQGLNPGLSILPPRDSLQKEHLLKIVGFPSHWSGWTILRYPQVWNKVEACLEQPELAYISLRSSRALIWNFARNEIDFFYPSEQKIYFSNPLIIAPHRTMLAIFMPNFSAIMLHGAGVIRKDSAVLFFAPDEGGKSSTVKLAAGMPVLNDDQIILRKQGGLIMAHATPFGSLTNGPQFSKLSAIFFLEKSSHFSLTPISTSDAIKFIWDENTQRWFMMPKKLRQQAFELIVDACRQARVYRMRFPRGFVDWDLIDQAALTPRH
jgi:hypothetical protein